MRKSRIFGGLLLIGVLFIWSCTLESPLERDQPVKEPLSQYYLSPTGSGEMDGSSMEDAADFLDTGIWNDISRSLTTTDVDVQFLDGEYGRAYTEKKPLVLSGMGHEEHQLVLKGSENVIFTLPEGVDNNSQIIDIRNSQNIVLDDFHFTGHGTIGYVVRITSTAGGSTSNITLQNSSFIDMEGVIYGATGAHQEGTSYISFINNTFKRVGFDSHAHFIYNSYGPQYIEVIDNHFEDCTGDFIRFRDESDFNLVKGNTFLKALDRFGGRSFVMMPVFNSREPVGDEYIPNNLSFVDNEFIHESNQTMEYAITFYHSGFSPPDRNYLLTEEERDIITSGTDEQKEALLSNNFGLDADKVRMTGNTITDPNNKIKRVFALHSTPGTTYGIEGYVNGIGDITSLMSTSSEPFDWESEFN